MLSITIHSITMADKQERASFLENLDLPSIGIAKNEKLNVGITEEEIARAIYRMKNNKSPGSDGFPSADLKKNFKQAFVRLFFGLSTL